MSEAIKKLPATVLSFVFYYPHLISELFHEGLKFTKEVERILKKSIFEVEFLVSCVII